MSPEEPLWRPSPEAVADLPLTHFAAEAARRAGRPLAGYAALHAWSVEDRGAFWDLVWDFTGVIGDKGERRLVDGDRMPGARFFPDARLNFAENLLCRNDDGEAIVFRGEDGPTRRITWRQLNDLVSRLQQALAAAGVGPGDRVAAYLPNIPEAIVAMLATASLGAVWSSASPDFGPRRRRRPLRPDRAEGVLRRRWLSLRRQGDRPCRQGEGDRAAVARRRAAPSSFRCSVAPTRWLRRCRRR